MASANSFLSEEQFMCSICMEMFTNPSTIPCGHNFCMHCITQYWDTTDLCQCPLCKRTFDTGPDLFVNTFISEMANQFRKSVEETKGGVTQQQPALSGEVPCDVCTGGKLKALKSCLVCLTSYCETHLEPHQRVAALRNHKLIDPMENLEDRMCEKHGRVLELFCRTDQTCVCVMCSDHSYHVTVPLEEEYRRIKPQLGKQIAYDKWLIQDKAARIKQMQRSVRLSKTATEQEIAKCNQSFNTLTHLIERSKTKQVENFEKRQKETEKQAESYIKALEQEISQIKRRSEEMEKLSHTEDQLHLLLNLPPLANPIPSRNWSGIGLKTDLPVGTVRQALLRLEKALIVEMNKLCDPELKMIRQYAVDVTFDPPAVFSDVIVSRTGKKARYDNCGTRTACGLYGKESFSSGQFYYEVGVTGKTNWGLGITTEHDSNRVFTLGCLRVHWSISLKNGNNYQAISDSVVSLSLAEEPEIVGVFVDYEAGQVSFYDVGNKSHIYTFIECRFTGTLYTSFSPGISTRGKNSEPLIIIPLDDYD